MILTCPACTTRYLLDPVALRGNGRMVRCAKCGHSWMQRPPAEAPATVQFDPIPEQVRPIPPGSNLPVAPKKRPRRKLKPIWLLLPVLLLGAAAVGGYAGRQQIVDLWPVLADIYESAHITVDPPGAGLELRNVRSERRDQDGGVVLVIEGQIANASARARRVPGLRALALGPDKVTLNDWAIAPSHDRLLPGEIATFQSTLPNPPDNVLEIAITFQGG
jgi:predicted Zn finger-like uncharacterized protein